MLLAAVMLTVGCSDDGVEDRRQMVEVEVAPYASDYTYMAPVNVGTRATEPTEPSWAPTGYYLYTDLDGADDIMKSNQNAKIFAFFTKVGSADPVIRNFRYVSGTSTWKIDEAINASTAENPYYLYGLVPYGSAEVAIEPYKAPGAEGDGNYADGAIMTFSGLGSVMSMDPCVIVGAKHGSKVGETIDPVGDNPMKAGDFSCVFGVSNDVQANKDNPNYLFLLFDHLYSAIRFRFCVGDEYAKLRDIHLTKLEMLAYTDASCEDEYLRKQFVRTTVTLHKTLDGSSPIVGSIDFIPYGDEDMTKVKIYSGDKEIPHGKYPADYEDEELRGKKRYTDNMGFVPNVNSYFKLISTYDVYDTKGNLVRKNCVAENKIDPFSIFQTVSLGRRKLYTLNLTIEPTYLYVLSEPDLDNPTVTVE